MSRRAMTRTQGVSSRWSCSCLIVAALVAGVEGFSPLAVSQLPKHFARQQSWRSRVSTSQQSMLTYGEALIVAPVATKAATAAGLGLLGDSIAQVAEKKGETFDFDWGRSGGMALFALVYTGFFQAWWIEQLGKWVHMDSALAEAAVKTFLCQFGSIPLIYMPTFFLITGALRGEVAEAITDRARRDYMRIYTRNVGFWIPVQMVQFFYIAPSWQITYLSAMGLVWNTILSLIGMRTPIPDAASAEGFVDADNDSATADERELADSSLPR
mmetsp:Transcript_24548/g.49029  ORF Transcript_24548/g.49029 Transcript_24548/m.49029 type:complete len:270 (+) Transcript_24548:7-816(+)